jgi:hemoglobin-like flavoprotein
MTGLVCRGHLKYGVKAEHYTLLTDAIAVTLQQALGDGWNSEQRTAWGNLIALLAAIVTSAYATGALLIHGI